MMVFAVLLALLVVVITIAISYRLGAHRGVVQQLPDTLTKRELSNVLQEFKNIGLKLEGQHSAVVSEKDRMLSSAELANRKLSDWATEYEQRIKKIDDSLGSISQQAVTEVKNMSGVIQPVIAMFKTPQTAGIQYAEAELELLLKVHLGNGLFERKPSWLSVGSETVDFIVKLPDCVIPIDSKFPEGVYRSWTEARDGEVESKSRWRLFRDAVLRQLEATSKYIRPEAGTVDYALLFLPTDVIWHQAFSVDRWYGEENPIPRRSQELRVYGCSAQTLMPYIGLLRLGLRNLKVAEDVRAVRQQIDQLKTSFGRFDEDWRVLRKHLGNAQNMASEAEGTKGSFSALQRDVDRLTGHEQEIVEGVGLQRIPTEEAGTERGVPA